MYVVCVTAYDKKNLPEMMLHALKARREHGLLDGLIHIKDDIICKLKHGWGMLSHWDTPEEVDRL